MTDPPVKRDSRKPGRTAGRLTKSGGRPADCVRNAKAACWLSSQPWAFSRQRPRCPFPRCRSQKRVPLGKSIQDSLSLARQGWLSSNLPQSFPRGSLKLLRRFPLASRHASGGRCFELSALASRLSSPAPHPLATSERAARRENRFASQNGPRSHNVRSRPELNADKNALRAVFGWSTRGG